MKSTTDEADFLGLVIDVVVEVGRVCPGWYEHNHNFAVLALLVALLDPLADLSAVRRVAEHSRSRPPPFLRKSVIINSIMTLALGVLVGTARVEIEVELRVQTLIEVGRSCPFATVR